MNFDLSEEQIAIRDTIRELVQDRVAPRAAEIDEKAEYPKDIERLFAENGILGIPFPEEYGGISGSSVTICMGIEEIAKACATSSLILAVQASRTREMARVGLSARPALTAERASSSRPSSARAAAKFKFGAGKFRFASTDLPNHATACS